MTIEAPTFQLPRVLQNPQIFLPETLTPQKAILLDESTTGALFELGKDKLGEFYFVKPRSETGRNLIIHNRNNRRNESLKRPPAEVDYSSLATQLSSLSEHISDPENIAVSHRISQEEVQKQWNLISKLLESKAGEIITEPACFLEVSCENSNSEVSGVADAVGMTRKGNLIVMEHTSRPTSQAGSPQKYRQVENHSKSLLAMLGLNLSVRPVCIFYESIDDKNFFLKIGHANSDTIHIIR